MFDEYEDDDGMSIAQITFAFRNARMVKWLQNRGTYIKNMKWDKVDNIEKEIFEALHSGD